MTEPTQSVPQKPSRAAQAWAVICDKYVPQIGDYSNVQIETELETVRRDLDRLFSQELGFMDRRFQVEVAGWTVVTIAVGAAPFLSQSLLVLPLLLLLVFWKFRAIETTLDDLRFSIKIGYWMIDCLGRAKERLQEEKIPEQEEKIPEPIAPVANNRKWIAGYEITLDNFPRSQHGAEGLNFRWQIIVLDFLAIIAFIGVFIHDPTNSSPLEWV
jgi:hypothetical protein